MVCHCDNAAVVTIINSGSSKNPLAMQLMRSLFFMSAHFNFAISARFLPGSSNQLADALSHNKPERFFSLHPQANQLPTPIPCTRTLANASTQSTRLDLKLLENDVQFFYAKGLAPSTLRSYKSGKDRYTNFCSQASIIPLPVSESKLCLFVSHIAKKGLKHQTIKCYLSAIRHLQISNGFSDPFAGDPLPRLDYVMRGIKKHQAELLSGQQSRLPITPDILSNIKKVWDTTSKEHDTIMLWVACCLAFFGFLRIGEITVPSDSGYDPSTHLSLADVAFNHATDPSQMDIFIKQSKTDPFRKGVTLTLG